MGPSRLQPRHLSQSSKPFSQLWFQYDVEMTVLKTTCGRTININENVTRSVNSADKHRSSVLELVWIECAFSASYFCEQTRCPAEIKTCGCVSAVQA